MKRWWMVFCLFGLISLAATACARKSTVCATDPPNLPIEVRQSLDISENPTDLHYPVEVKIRNQIVSVDKIVHGFVCDDQWTGTVYVDCDVEVPEYEVVNDEEANFFAGCDLQIEEGALVYVAFHNDEVFYKGCSCHTNE